jgi:hypothetical protein
MSYATLMVHVDSSKSGEQRLRLAVGLAQRFQAALIGIAARSYLPTFLAELPRANAAANDGERSRTADLLARLGSQFETAAGHVRHREWRGRIDYVNTIVPREARAADLLIAASRSSLFCA